VVPPLVAPAATADPPVQVSPPPPERTPAPRSPSRHGRETPTKVLEHYLERSDRDHYAFLELEEDAEAAAIRLAWSQIEAELLDARSRATAVQKAPFTALLGRLGRARAALDDLEGRALYDSRRGNFRGVACSLGAGLPAEKLEKLHVDYAARFPDRLAQAETLSREATSKLEAGQSKAARDLLVKALNLDPLSPVLHRRWADLKG